MAGGIFLKTTVLNSPPNSKKMKSIRNILVQLLFGSSFEDRKYSVLKIPNHVSRNKYYENLKAIKFGGKNIFQIYLDDLQNDHLMVNDLIFYDSERFVNTVEEILNLCIDYYSKDILRNCEIFPESLSKFDPSLFPEKKVEGYNFQLEIIPTLKFPIKGLRQIGVESIGNFILIEGMICSCSRINYIVDKLIYGCSNCKKKFSLTIKYFKKNEQILCPNINCKRKNYLTFLFPYFYPGSYFLTQTLKITCINNPIYSIFDTVDLEVELKQFQCGNFLAGEYVKIFGILKPVFSNFENKNIIIKRLYLESFYLEKTKINFSKEITDYFNEEKTIEKYSLKNLEEHFSSDFIPCLSESKIVKKSLIFSIASSSNYYHSKNLKFDSGISILLHGQSIYTTNSILYFISKITKFSSIIIPLLNNSLSKSINKHYDWDIAEISNRFYPIKHECKENLILIDGVDNITDNYLNQLLFRKFRIKSFPIANNSFFQEKIFPVVIATGNQKPAHFGEKIPGNSALKNFLYEKFDIFLTISEEPDRQKDFKIANKIIEKFYLNQSRKQANHQPDEAFFYLFMEKVKRIKTLFTFEYVDLITIYYSLSKISSIHKSAKLKFKTLELLVKLSISCARCNFKTKVEQKDIKDAIQIIEYQKNEIDPFSETSVFKKESNDEITIYNIIRSICISKISLNIRLLEIEKSILKKGFGRKDLAKCLVYYEKIGVWKINVQEGNLIFIS